MLARFLALALFIAAVSAANVNPTLRLRGGGVMSNIANSLGWFRDAVGPSELGCGPLPQVKRNDRHADERAAKKKKHDGSGMTRSHSFTIPDVTGQR
jgi:hypothetical protein